MIKIYNRHILVGAAVALLILLTVIVSGYKAMDESQKSSEWVAHTLSAISEINKVETSVLNLVNSKRGYVITGQDRYEKEYQGHKVNLEQGIELLKKRTKDNPIQQQRIDQLKNDMSYLRTIYDQDVVDVQAGKFVKAIERIKVGHTQDKLDHIKGLLSEMNNSEEDLLETRLAVQKEATNFSNILVLSGSILSFLIVLIAAYLVMHEFKRRNLYEKVILKAREQAIAGTQAKTEFLANMSHEIRTPMNAIMGMAELLNETNLNDEQRKYVDVFQRAGESLLNIINDILDLSKIEAGHFELDKIPFTLSTVVDKATEIMALKAHQKQLELAVDIDPELHDYFFGDPNRLRQVLLNLIGNAVKFTKKGEVVLKVQSGQKNYNIREIIFEVTDTGIGMNQHQIENLYERFNQADSSITKEYGGTGLGLNITKRLIELMNGTIQVESKEGVGTKFIVKIYLEEDDKPQDEVPPLSLKDKKIIIIDDTKTNRFILKKIVEHQGATAHEAESGEIGLSMIHSESQKNAPYDLVLLDCRMPGLDGFKVAEKVQSTELKGPMILMLTSDNRPGDLAKSRALGLKSYLVKPVLKQELLTEIGKALFNVQAKPVTEVKAPMMNHHDDLKILLVDDNDENRLVIRSFLKAFPWKVEEAKNGKEALDMFETGKYDLVLMDMQMPILDGYSATREIRKREDVQKAAPTPIIALTAYALKEEVDKSLEAGCNGHQSKPVAKASLVKCIEDFTKTLGIIVDKDLEDLIPDYLGNREKEVVTLTDLYHKKEFAQIQAIGHKLRGSAGSYGFSELSEIGKELEEKSKVADSTSINHALNQYRLYLKRIRVSFE